MLLQKQKHVSTGELDMSVDSEMLYVIQTQHLYQHCR